MTHGHHSRPNLFLIGAAKSGTTALARCMDQHPQVFVSRPKEPNFFAFPPNQPPTCRGPIDTTQLTSKLLAHAVTDLETYERLFVDAFQKPIRCDASVRYLYSQDAPARIHGYAADSKLIAILRNPIDRLHSHYHMNVRMGIEPESLTRAIELEDDRVRDDWGWDWHYVRVSRYAQQLRRYYQLFPKRQILVVFFEEYRRDPHAVLRKVFTFLNVATEHDGVGPVRSNVGETPRLRSLRRLLWEDNVFKSAAQRLVPKSARRVVSTWIDSVNRRPVPELDMRLRSQLQTQLADDRRELEVLLERKLPW